jgi:hypothetical protein
MLHRNKPFSDFFLKKKLFHQNDFNNIAMAQVRNWIDAFFPPEFFNNHLRVELSYHNFDLYLQFCRIRSMTFT